MGIEIGRLGVEDLPFAKGLTDGEEWNRGETDWRRLLALEPDGFFKANLDGVEAGIVGSMRYDRVSWINSLIVGKGFRGMHVAEALMRHCLDYSERSGATTIKLDSVTGVEPFYERLGFRAEFRSLRYFGKVREPRNVKNNVSTPDLDEVLALDREEIGIDRGKVLRALFSEPSARHFASRDGAGITGYLLTRQAQGRVDLGPCVVRDGDLGTAEELIRAATAAIDSPTFKLCVLGKNEGAARMIGDLGFEPVGGTTRMSKGVPFDEPLSIVTMMSPEKG
jgi:GNAT superfamily N-acetyltransferase